MIRSLVGCLAILLGAVQTARAEVTQGDVRDAIAAGVRYLNLKRFQEPLL